MKELYPTLQFEAALRRATRRKGNDDQVREVASHYDDLYQEALTKGATVEEARKHADDHIGNVADIAKGIRAGNGQSNGIKLQWIAMVLFVFGALLYRVLTINGVEIGSLRGNMIESTAPFGLILVYAAGFFAVLGIVRAKRVAILAFCLATILIPASQTVILLRNSRSFSTYDAKIRSHNESWHQYAITYRPIMKERYDLYVTSISGGQEALDKAIRKLSETVKRPQDRGVVILVGGKGQWIYPLKAEEVRKRNIRVFPYRDTNLNYVNFGATDSFEKAQKAWRSSNDLLKAMPILRKGSEAEFANTSHIQIPSAATTIKQDSLASMIPFLYSFILSFLMVGLATKIDQLIKRRRRAL